MSYLPLQYTFMGSSLRTPAQVELYQMASAKAEITDETFSSSSLFENAKQKAHDIFSKIVDGLHSIANYISSFGKPAEQKEEPLFGLEFVDLRATINDDPLLEELNSDLFELRLTKSSMHHIWFKGYWNQ